MTVSVIIPVYNVERYLPRCLDSVIAAAEHATADGREVSSVEVICVDDGSPDGSAAILARYRDTFAGRSDGRLSFRIITKPNGGLGSARNAGMAAAAGEYLMFVDSDDYIPRNAIAVFAETASASGSALVVSAAVVKDTGEGGRCESSDEKAFTIRDRNWIAGKKVQYSAWNKFYRRELIVGRPFPPGMYEDFSWTTSIFCDLDSFAVVDTPLYVYCLNQGAVSIVRSKYSNRKTVDSFAAITRVLDHAVGSPARAFALRQAADGLNSTIGQVYKAVRKTSAVEGAEFRKELKKRLEDLFSRYPEMAGRLSIKARFRLWRLRK